MLVSQKITVCAKLFVHYSYDMTAKKNIIIFQKRLQKMQKYSIIFVHATIIMKNLKKRGNLNAKI